MVEVDPHGKAANEPGSKLDAGKPKVFEYVLGYFPNAIKAVAKVSEYGALKYTSMGWSSVPDGRMRYAEALIRHSLDEAENLTWNGKDTPDVSGLEHDAQMAWNALAKLELRIREGTQEKS